jgi:tryptophan-rich sensory protein
MKTWKRYIPEIAFATLSLFIGGIGGILTKSGMPAYETMTKPWFTPPAWAFPIVWTILYILMGIGVAQIWMAPASEERSRGIRLFIAQLAVNFLWSPIFFNLRVYPLAFLWLLLLWGLVAWMIGTFRRVDSLAGKLQLPYLLWLTFAAYLCAGVWYLNG